MCCADSPLAALGCTAYHGFAFAETKYVPGCSTPISKYPRSSLVAPPADLTRHIPPLWSSINNCTRALRTGSPASSSTCPVIIAIGISRSTSFSVANSGPVTIAVEYCSCCSYPEVMYPLRDPSSAYFPAGNPANSKWPPSPVTVSILRIRDRVSATLTITRDSAAPVTAFTTVPAILYPCSAVEFSCCTRVVFCAAPGLRASSPVKTTPVIPNGVREVRNLSLIPDFPLTLRPPAVPLPLAAHINTNPHITTTLRPTIILPHSPLSPSPSHSPSAQPPHVSPSPYPPSSSETLHLRMADLFAPLHTPVADNPPAAPASAETYRSMPAASLPVAAGLVRSATNK